MPSLVGWKVISIFVVTTLAWVAALVPLTLVKWQKKYSFGIFLSLANAFGGGVFLTVGLLHLLPEVAKGVDKTVKFFRYPLPFYLLLAGYLIVLLLEKVIFVTKDDELAETHDSFEYTPPHVPQETYDSPFRMRTKSHPSINSPVSDDDFYIEYTLSKNRGKWGIFSRIFTKSFKRFDDALYGNSSSLTDALILDDSQKAFSWQDIFSPLVIAAVLTIHSFFEGLLIGVQLHKSLLVQLLFAVMSHKWVESLTVGIQLLRSRVKKRTFFIFVSVFALLNPLGILLGIILTGILPTSAVIYLDAFACGSFVYIGSTEIIVEEFTSPKLRWYKYLALFSGCFVIAMMQALVPD